MVTRLNNQITITNEINTRFEVNGSNLELEDSNGTLQVALTDISTDDQNAGEVNLVTPVDSDGDTTNETTVEEVIQAIAPITSASGRIFYPPSIAIDASTNGLAFNIDLYQQYLDQYSGADPTTFVSSMGAPNIPTYARTDLYYYVTFFDTSVFDNVSIDADGMMTYDIVGQPTDYNSLINVVFVVK